MRNQYTITEFISTAISLVITKIFYSPARLVRRPFYLRGKKSMVFGEGLTTGHSCRFDLPGDHVTLTIGKHCEMGDNVHIVAHEEVRIGDNVLMASKIFISDTNHGEYKGVNSSSPMTSPNSRAPTTKRVYIGNNVWIGENVCVLPGVSIGDGCIIGANSVVNKDIPKHCIAVGIPTKVVKTWHEESSSWKKVK